jgi:hypothetical protein
MKTMFVSSSLGYSHKYHGVTFHSTRPLLSSHSSPGIREVKRWVFLLIKCASPSGRCMFDTHVDIKLKEDDRRRCVSTAAVQLLRQRKNLNIQAIKSLMRNHKYRIAGP